MRYPVKPMVEQEAKGFIVAEGGHLTWTTQQESRWQCELAPTVIWHPMERQVPNAFHRLMQRLCFGFKWSKR